MPSWNHSSTRPLDEPLHRALIDTLAGLGRRWEAIEVYERLRTGLDEAYAVEPEPETKALYRRLLSAGQAMPGTIPHNLPESTTSFIGRRRLLTELSAGLGRTRLLTLTGVGGVGKSRSLWSWHGGRQARSSPTESGWSSWLESKTQRSSRQWLPLRCDSPFPAGPIQR